MTQTRHNSTLSSSRLFSQLIELLTVIKWIREGHDNEPAFQRVDIFYDKDVVQAAEELLNFKDRYCYIIPPSDEFNSMIRGNNLQTNLVQNVSLLLSDRKYGFGHSKALLGSEDNPGIYRLRDLVLESVTGTLISPEDKSVCCLIEPIGGEILALSNSDRESLSCRLIYELRIKVMGQYLYTSTGNKPIPYHP